MFQVHGTRWWEVGAGCRLISAAEGSSRRRVAGDPWLGRGPFDARRRVPLCFVRCLVEVHIGV